jgi:CxxC motif-containing protein (DUF1111 family)
MSRLSLADQRKLVGFGMTAAFGVALFWVFSPSVGLWWGPYASAATKEAGRELFEHEWSPHDPLAKGDGLGPVFNAKSCVACHFQGGVGGGGEVAHNAVGFEALATPSRPEFTTGTVHNFSTDPAQKESLKVVRQKFPAFKFPPPPPPPPGHCGYAPGPRPDFDPVRTESVQATALFGAGWVDRISGKAITYNMMNRLVKGTVKELNHDFSDTVGGRVRMLSGGRVGKFGWKAQFATLEEFVAAACANELGLGTPMTTQAVSVAAKDAPEVNADLDRRQFGALVAFVETLPKPVEAEPASPAEADAAARGKGLFGSVGCALCHVPDLGGVTGVYSDLLLHVVENPTKGGSFDEYGPEPLPEHPRPEDLPRPEEWKTPALWGVADSAPYFHDGSSATLADAILRHQGEAKGVTAAYKALSPTDQQAVVAFLKTLKAPPDAIPLRDKSVTKLAKR